MKTLFYIFNPHTKLYDANPLICDDIVTHIEGSVITGHRLHGGEQTWVITVQKPYNYLDSLMTIYNPTTMAHLIKDDYCVWFVKAEFVLPV